MFAILVGPSQGSYRRTVVEVEPVLILYKGLSDSPSFTVESRNDGEDNFKVSRGFLRREGISSFVSRRRRYGNIVEVAEGTEEGHLEEEEAIFKKSWWPSG